MEASWSAATIRAVTAHAGSAWRIACVVVKKSSRASASPMICSYVDGGISAGCGAPLIAATLPRLVARRDRNRPHLRGGNAHDGRAPDSRRRNVGACRCGLSSRRGTDTTVREGKGLRASAAIVVQSLRACPQTVRSPSRRGSEHCCLVHSPRARSRRDDPLVSRRSPQRAARRLVGRPLAAWRPRSSLPSPLPYPEPTLTSTSHAPGGGAATFMALSPGMLARRHVRVTLFDSEETNERQQRLVRSAS